LNVAGIRRFHYEISLNGFGVTQFPVEITQVECWRLHSFHYGKSLTGFDITQFRWWRLHRLNVGDYIVFTMGNPLKGFELAQFLVEITQVEQYYRRRCLLSSLRLAGAETPPPPPPDSGNLAARTHVWEFTRTRTRELTLLEY
jgi:hypothetical protein